MAPLHLESRRRILDAVEQRPGIHFRELQDRVGLAAGTLQHHLHVLQTSGLLVVARERQFTRYYAPGAVRAHDRPLVAALRREGSRSILARLADDGPTSTRRLAAVLGRSESTISWHLARLAEAGLVERRRSGQEVHYAIVDRAHVIGVYLQYRASFTDRVLDRLVGLWDAY